ncbi:hypothetical protein, conserved [Plasmodium gonderi]|uniref:RING-type domain-containing protein n=1 Tax=Plasmodium gonderi TaxID=77519 RepID=A0A1Y1J9G0_PLAGO|nr:hypothetical protein, conserved [Plasmodium gonderi]GAW79141.1 hypothetical protein, conserved [Plasmodium gonderi]
MYIQYRLFSEHSVWRLLEINKSENYILASELKHIICKQSNINYQNKIDIYFSVYKEDHDEVGEGVYGDGDSNYTNEKNLQQKSTSGGEKEIIFLSGEDKIYNGTKILIHRNIKKKSNVSDITHKAKKEISVDVEEKQKINVPNEFLCKLCNCILIDSHIIVCSNNCGYSVCKSCILFYILNKFVIHNEKKTNPVIDMSRLKNTTVMCPLCNGLFKYCIWNKKLEMTLKKLLEERNDIDSFKFNVEERNSKFIRILEKFKIENFDNSAGDAGDAADAGGAGTVIAANIQPNSNIFEHEIFKAIEAKYILTSAKKKKTNDPLVVEEAKMCNHFLYLMSNNKLNCIKEFNLIYLEFENPIFDTVQKMNIKALYNQMTSSSPEPTDTSTPQLFTSGKFQSGTETTDLKMSNCSGDDTRNAIEREGNHGIKQNSNNENLQKKKETDNAEDKIDEDVYKQNKTYIIPISFVGGETSYSLIGIFYVKDTFKQITADSNADDETKGNLTTQQAVIQRFMNKWFMDEQRGNLNLSEKLKYGNIYTLGCIYMYEKICFFPARKQPIYNIINNKRQKSKKKNNIEISLDLRKFLDVVFSVNNYIKYGSRPNNYESKKVMAPIDIPFANTEEEEEDDEEEEKEEWRGKNTAIESDHMVADSTVLLHSAHNQVEEKRDLNEDIKERSGNSSTLAITGKTAEKGGAETVSTELGLTRQSEFQEILEILYDTKVPPVTIQKSFNVTNPYADYCALLPFLTKEDFFLFRKLQRIYKEKYLRHLYRHVKQNNLNMNIFFNAVNSVFFSTTR